MSRQKLRPLVDREEAGFTLIELLVVIVIIPLLIGAISEAIIVSFGNTTVTSSRLSDAVNAEGTSAFFTRDVQGATLATADGALSKVFSLTAPSLCGSGSQLLLGLFRPADFSGSVQTTPAEVVSYWLRRTNPGTPTEKAQIVRYACNSSSTSLTTITDVPSGTSVGNSIAGSLEVSADFTPYVQTAAATSAWIPTSMYTTTTATSTLPSLTVASSSGFVAGTVTVGTFLGNVSYANCSASGSTTISCPGSNGTLYSGALVTEPTITGITLDAIEPGTNYHFSVTGTPRTSYSGQATYQQTSTTVPALLTLGSAGIYVQDHNDAIQVAGSVEADGGPIKCSGNAKKNPLQSVTGQVLSTGSGSTCLGVGGATASQDPIAGLLPPFCFPVLPGGGADPNNPTNLMPGRYTTAISGTLEPGVYELDAGIGGPLTLASGYAPTAGVLIFLPGTGLGINCAKASGSPPAVPAGLNLPPLGTGPLPSVFGNNAEMRDLWLWQDVTNPQPISWTGNSSADSVCPASTPDAGKEAGLAYLPSASISVGGSSYIHTGTLAANSLVAYGANTVSTSGLLSCSS